MDFDTYQKGTSDTAIYPKERAMEYLGLGLASEAGEIASMVKKVIRDGGELDKQALVKELGDILWYAARVASEMGVPLSSVAETNYKKLMDRKQRGVLGGSGDNR